MHVRRLRRIVLSALLAPLGLVVGCARSPDRTPTVDEVEALARRSLSLARGLPTQRAYAPPPPFVPARPTDKDRVAAIESLVRGREALAKGRWDEARSALEDAVRHAPDDSDLRADLGRAIRRGAPPDGPAGAPHRLACTDPVPTIEALCACLAAADEGEHCLPAEVRCAIVGKQGPDGSMFVVRMGRDDELGPQPRWVVAARRDGGFHAVHPLAIEVRGSPYRSGDDIEVENDVLRTDAGRSLFRVHLRTSVQRAGLVEDSASMVRRDIFCLPPTREAPARCPVDVVVSSRFDRTSAFTTQPPLPPALASRLQKTTVSVAPTFVHVGREITDEGLRTWLIDGKITDLPPNTVGFHPWNEPP